MPSFHGLTSKNTFYLPKILVNTWVNWKSSFICACFLVVNPCSTNTRSLLKHRHVKNIPRTCEMTSRGQASSSCSYYTHSNQLHRSTNWWEFSGLSERINLCFKTIAHTETLPVSCRFPVYVVYVTNPALCDEWDWRRFRPKKISPQCVQIKQNYNIWGAHCEALMLP